VTWGAGAFIALIGFMTGLALFSFLVRWFALGYEAWAQLASASPESTPWGRLLTTVAAQSLFHSAPWLIVAVAIFAYHVHAEPWAEWFFWGFGIGITYMTFVAIQIMRRRKHVNAA
jgi:hypothetical protein